MSNTFWIVIQFDTLRSDDLSLFFLTKGASRLRLKPFERWLAEEIGKFPAEVAGEISKLRAEMHDLRAKLIQWMFVFWIGQIGVLVGFLFTFLKK